MDWPIGKQTTKQTNNKHTNHPKAGSSVVTTTGTGRRNTHSQALSAHSAPTGSSAAPAVGTGEGTQTTHHTTQAGSSVAKATGTKEGDNKTRAISAHLVKTGSLVVSSTGTGNNNNKNTTHIQHHPDRTGSSVVPTTGTSAVNNNPSPKEAPRSVSPKASCSFTSAPGQEEASGQRVDEFTEGWQLPKRKGQIGSTLPKGAGGKASAEPNKPSKWKTRKTRKERRIANSIKKASLLSATKPSPTSPSKTEAQGPTDQDAAKLALPTSSAKAKEGKQRPDGKGQSSAKRALNETISPRGEHKKQRLDQTRQVAKTTYAQAASTPLSVAITCALKGSISRDVSEQVLVEIQKRIFSDALACKQIQPPKFKAKPIYSEGVLKLWCANEHTRTWLHHAVSEMVLTTNVKLVVKNQSDIPQRARCGILVPDPQGLLEDARNIGRVLSFQNPEVEVTKWTLLNATKQNAAWFVVVGIPEDQVPTLMKAGRRLSFGVGTVYVKFQGRSGKFTDVPLGWDASTASIKQELKRRPVAVESEPPTNTAGPSVVTQTASSPTPANVEQEDAPMESESEDILASISNLLGSEVESGELLAELKLGRDEEGMASDGVPFVDS